jgi:hypothetical protein
MPRKGSQKRLAVIDLETDPFKAGRLPLPFVAGFFDGDNYEQFWGDDCIEQLMAFLEAYDAPLLIYAHNGGKFDYWYMAPWITGPLMFIKSRLVKGMIFHHEIRDSYSILPVPLRDYKKDDTDYATFEYDVRERHRKAICRYLQHDCEYLYELVSQFKNEFGSPITMGSAALKELKKDHPQKHESALHDAEFRPFYFGGRVECFQFGEIKGDYQFYDVNSMYPFVMRDYDHPQGDNYFTRRRLPDSGFYFADIEADSKGALPIRDKNGALRFPHGRHRFLACSHEIQAGLENNLLRNVKVYRAEICQKTQRFEAFVDRFVKRKIEYEQSGDTAMRLFMKLVLNSAYGKFATDPSQFKDTFLYDDLQSLLNDGCGYAGNFGCRLLGEKPALIRSYSFHDVAVAASITSASRAVLLQGLSRSRQPLYCDTDSIVAQELDMPIHPTQLGAFKTEARADTVYIGGKKMYAASHQGTWVKKASKGVNLSHEQIKEIALGGTVLAELDAPNMRLGKPAKFIARTIALTK